MIQTDRQTERQTVACFTSAPPVIVGRSHEILTAPELSADWRSAGATTPGQLTTTGSDSRLTSLSAVEIVWKYTNLVLQSLL